MRSIFFGIGEFIQATFDCTIVPAGWSLPVIFTIVLAFGALYWMMAQAKYTRRAKERNETI